VGGRLGGMEPWAGYDAEHERDGNGQQQRCCNRNADDGLGRRGLAGRWALRADEGQAQVISRGYSRVEEADDGQGDGASVYRGAEGVELAEEAAGEGNANERDEEEDEQAGEEGRAVHEPAVVVDKRKMFVVSADQRDDGEDADVHGGVGGEVNYTGDFVIEREAGGQRVADIRTAKAVVAGMGEGVAGVTSVTSVK